MKPQKETCLQNEAGFIFTNRQIRENATLIHSNPSPDPNPNPNPNPNTNPDPNPDPETIAGALTHLGVVNSNPSGRGDNDPNMVV